MVSEIRRHRWRQGRVIPATAHELLRDHAKLALSETDCCIVVSQSCDLLFPDLDAEPLAEIVVAKPLAEGVELDGNFTFAKNARRLHLEIDIDGQDVAHELLIRNRFSIPRALLKEFPPDLQRTLPESEIETAVRWVIARYERTAFPDQFNSRVERADRKIKAIVKKMPEVSDIYISLSSWDELKEWENYKVGLTGITTTVHFSDSDTLGRLETSIARIATQLNECPGIEVIDSTIKSEDEMTIGALKRMARFCNFDYISLADERHEPSSRV